MITVVKIGGNVINDPEELDRFLKDFSQLEGKKILVHGGGKEATELSKKLGVETVMIEGRRVTDKDTISIVTMVYAGLVNKRIVARLQSFGCDAIGLTGADANVMPAVKRPADPIDYGFVGDINPDNIKVRFISQLLNDRLVPVFCAICHDGKGDLLNCNADTIASSVAVACSKLDNVRLIYCFEKNGILQNVENDDSVISYISPSDFEELKTKGIISGGMIPKVFNAVESMKKGVDEVRICNSSALNSSGGTLISNV